DEVRYEDLSTEQRQRLFDRVEEEIMRMEARKTDLEELMADSNVFLDAGRMEEATKEYANLLDTLAGRMRQWEELAELMSSEY
ncbi:MAG: ABC transporter C-terminal domain-containing protein, partial [Bacteroidota bacterium]